MDKDLTVRDPLPIHQTGGTESLSWANKESFHGLEIQQAKFVGFAYHHLADVRPSIWQWCFQQRQRGQYSFHCSYIDRAIHSLALRLFCHFLNVAVETRCNSLLLFLSCEDAGDGSDIVECDVRGFGGGQ